MNLIWFLKIRKPKKDVKMTCQKLVFLNNLKLIFSRLWDNSWILEKLKPTGVSFCHLETSKKLPDRSPQTLEFGGSDPTWWFCLCRLGLGHGHSRRGHPPRRRWWLSGLSARRPDFHIHLIQGSCCYPTLERGLLELSVISTTFSRSYLTLKLSCA